MLLFELGKANTVIIKPPVLLIKEFKALNDRDKSKNKNTAILEYAFVYFLADYKSVYLSYPPEEREQSIIEDLFDKDWEPDELVYEAVNKYKALQMTPTMRLIKSGLNALEKMVGYFNSIDFTERDSKRQAVYKPKEVTSSLGDIAKVSESLKKLDESVRKELKELVKARGGDESGLFEDYDFNE